MRKLSGIFLVLLLLLSCKEDPPVNTGALQLASVSVGTEKLSLSDLNVDFPFDMPVFIRFSQAVDISTVTENVSIQDDGGQEILLTISYLDNDKTLSLIPDKELSQQKNYSIIVGKDLLGKNGETFPGFTLSFTTKSVPLSITELSFDGVIYEAANRMTDVSFQPEIVVQFSDPVSISDLMSYTTVVLGSLTYDHAFTQVNDTVISISVTEQLPHLRRFRFIVSEFLTEVVGKDFSGLNIEFYTQLDDTDKFPRVSDDVLLDLVQEQTFKYFWDFAHPTSGLNRERNSSNDNVTSGGSGFGIMAIPLGIERGYITREEGVERLQTIVDFVGNTADRFHGVWPHWLSGSTGAVNPFSVDDDGGDLVETSYLAMGLLTARQYLNVADTDEAELITDIDEVLDAIEWDFYTQGENSLTWHWSPKIGFDKNMKIRGWNEALITYVMAASSSTHTISKEVYEQGWGGGSNMVNGKDYYGITLPLGPSNGGPLFFEQYSFLGLDPSSLSDQYGTYWDQVVNHTLINRQHCIVNPKGYVAYSEDCWGLTASDGDVGYSAHSPNNDRGVITPTAALSSIAFTPEQSMDAMRFFYYKLGDRLWGPYGFYDAFNVTANWYGTTNIAIDQGPILLMIENYRTGLLWDLFMSAPEVQSGLTKLGFTYE